MIGTAKKLTFALGAAAVVCLAQTGASAAENKNTWGIGVEGFRDVYKEPDLDVDVKTNYGAVDGYYQRKLSKKMFFAADGRVSYGTDDYSSPSGQLSGVPQWEAELRLRVGTSFQFWGGEMSPYIGIGSRWFLDKGKGNFTNTGAEAYDRRINQWYIPVGTSLSYETADGWSITPQAEADFMFYGLVDTRLTNLVGTGVQYLDPAYNDQHFGIGLRSELMFGKQMGNYTVQMGPFVRYWYVNKSDTVTYFDTAGNPAVDVYEPKNNRTQLGVKLRVLW